MGGRTEVHEHQGMCEWCTRLVSPPNCNLDPERE